jgi:hypothetical protein
LKREIGKEQQLAGLKRCRGTFHEETPSVIGMISRLRPLDKDKPMRVGTAINKAICGTKADPCPHICSDQTAVPWMFEAVIVLEL